MPGTRIGHFMELFCQKEFCCRTFHMIEINYFLHLLNTFPYEGLCTRIFSEVEGHLENNGQFISGFNMCTKMHISNSGIEQSIVSCEYCPLKTKK